MTVRVIAPKMTAVTELAWLGDEQENAIAVECGPEFMR